MTFMGEGYYRGMEETYSRRIDELMKENETLLSQNRELVEENKKLKESIARWEEHASYPPL